MTIRLYELPVLGEPIASGDLFPLSNVSIGNESSNVAWSTIVSAMATGLASTFAASSHTHTEYNDVIGYALLRDLKAQNTAGGTFTSGAWRTRTINDTAYDSGSGAWVSLASNQFTLQAGTYVIRVAAPAYAVDWHQAKLYNVTAGADVSGAISTVQRSWSSDGTVNFAHLAVYIIVASATTFELLHQCTTTFASSGFGTPGNITSEVYTQVEIWKLS